MSDTDIVSTVGPFTVTPETSKTVELRKDTMNRLTQIKAALNHSSKLDNYLDKPSSISVQSSNCTYTIVTTAQCIVVSSLMLRLKTRLLIFNNGSNYVPFHVFKMGN